MIVFLLCQIPLILFILCVGLIYGLEGCWLLRRIRKRPPAGQPRSKWVLLVHTLALLGILCLAWGYFVEPYRLKIYTFTIQTDKLEGTSLRIVQISDLHCDKTRRLEPRLVEEINRLHADLIVFTGDALNHMDALPLLRQTLGAMQASIGKYAVRGNVDNRKFKKIPLFEGTGFIEMPMDAVTLEKDGQSFGLCGIDYSLGRQSFYALRNLSPQRFNILLYHTSDLAGYLEPIPIDLYLSGHTHGGQVALPFWGALLTEKIQYKRYEAGLYRIGSFDLYVSRGIGMTDGWTPRVRFWARPEIAVFDIIPQDRIIPQQKPD